MSKPQSQRAGVGRVLDTTPTLPMRLARMSAPERAELSRIVRALKLRKIIRRTLAEAFWAGETARLQRELSDSAGSMQRLRQVARMHESSQNLERALTPSEGATVIETILTTSNGPRVIEVAR